MKGFRVMAAVLVLSVLLSAWCTEAATRAPAKKCPPNCVHRHHPCPDAAVPAAVPVILQTPALAPAPRATLGSMLIEGFYFTGGFLWERDREDRVVYLPCNAPRPAPPPLPPVKDPFYLGGGFRLPLGDRADARAEFRRLWTERADFQASAQIDFFPAARGGR